VAWLAAAAVGSVALAMVVSLAAISLARSAAVRPKYEKVEVGMTEEQVVGLLGEPLLTSGFASGPPSLVYQQRSLTMTWFFDDYTINIYFSGDLDEAPLVREKSIEPVPRTWLDRVKALRPF
jgi:hypothetical protein